MKKQESIYCVRFINQDKLYEIYCQHVYPSDMFGFLELEGFIFGERSQVLVDPGEERLAKEFSGVKRSFVPMHAVVRIDEVEKEGTPKISDSKGSATVTAFPATPPKKS
ncbi:DUF1820 family protein [Reinekea blandensis]|uniref:DUF1820 domain-containing protein n=1 Tax=Reinekea blandensis MED297 TaxID=314283 RepID=A4BC64_9GAMM|nr:DUF1820 family protein [Reinekea blandensis]EAR10130.1 hypothetical protein MED297_12942 [Reinekea sp. MED297] [Reinekea blandensis MED297]